MTDLPDEYLPSEDDNEFVWPEGKVATAQARARKNNEPKYHTKRCSHFPKKPTWIRMEIIEAWDVNFKECSMCDESNPSPHVSKEDWSKYALGRKNSRKALEQDD